MSSSISKQHIVELLKRWKSFLFWAILFALIFHFREGLSWFLTKAFLFALFVSHLLADELVQMGPEKSISRANPRVCTFELRLTKTFIEEVFAQLSNRFDEHKEVTSRLWPFLQKSSNATSELLQKLVIEEYPGRVRVHLWIVSNSEYEGRRYDWFDLDSSGGTYKNFDDGRSRCLWAYATDNMVGGDLSLSGSWEWDSKKKQYYFQLTLWVNHEVVRGIVEKEKQIPATDIIFKIPLDPEQLCDEQGQTIYKSYSGIDDWYYESGEGDAWRWSWYLRMKTFNSESAI